MMKKPKTKKIFQPITRGRVRRAMKSVKAFNEFMADIIGKENIIPIHIGEPDIDRRDAYGEEFSRTTLK